MAPHNNTEKKTITYVLQSSMEENDGHIGGINTVKYNNEARTLFSGGRDGTVKIWQSNSGHQEESSANRENFNDNLSTIGDTNNIECNNQLIADVATKINKSGIGIVQSASNPLYSLTETSQLHTDWVNDMELVSNQSLVSCSSDLLVKHWNYETNTQSTLGYHSDYVLCLASPNSNFKDIRNSTDAKWIASSGLDKQICTWDLVKNTKLKSYSISNYSSGSSNLNYYNFQNKGSVYSLSATNNLIAYGGTENTIGLIDTRSGSQSKNDVLKLVGHTDTVRSLILSDEWILSGSSDSTIKLWSLKNNRVLRTFDMHSSSVWSLYSDYADFRIFYSGDKNGYVFKTDTRGCLLSDQSFDNELDDTKNEILTSRLNENLGVVSLIAKQSRGISCLALENSNAPSGNLIDNGSNIWCSTDDNTIECYPNLDLKDVALHQYLTMKNGLLNIVKNSTVNELTSQTDDSTSSLNNNSEDIYDLVSQLSIDNSRPSMDQRPTSLTATSISLLDAIDNFSDTMSFNNDSGLNSGDDDDLNCNDRNLHFETSFTNSNGTANSQYIISGNDTVNNTENSQYFLIEALTDPIPAELVTVVPVNEDSIYSIEGNSAVIKARLLNDRRTLVSLNDAGVVRVWNAITGTIKKSFSQEEADENEQDVDYEEYDRLLREKGEHLFESVITSYQTKETLQNWCSVSLKIGRVFLTIGANTVTNCEVYIDELEGTIDSNLIEKIISENPTPMDEISINLGKVVLKSLLSNFVDEAVQDDIIFRDQIVKGQIYPAKAIKKEPYSRFEEENSRETDKNETAESGSNKEDINGNEEEGSSNANTFKKFSRFGRKSKKEEKDGSNSTTPMTSASKTKTKNSTPGPSKLNILPSTNYDDDDSLMAILDRFKYEYLKNPDPKELQNSNFKLPSPKEIPVVTSLTTNPFTVLVNKSSSDLKGNSLVIYKFHSNDTEFDNVKFQNFREFLPGWVGAALFKNQYSERSVTKIHFVVEEWKPDSGASSNFNSTTNTTNNSAESLSDGKTSSSQKRKLFSLNGKESSSSTNFGTLPVILDPTTRLSAHEYMRVKKIMFYILEKFPSKTPEMKKMYPFANIKYEDSVKVEDWLEILCNGEVLSPNMTLTTVKTKIWKNSGDIVLKYRRKKKMHKK
ncbi:Duf1 protein [Saccharomycopsis crataegensis]|uniref:Duf1 protein n=1 Tax=Saccharomycopsis crataegensis TaxID=43959 RepID=A0AAV5QLC8_9ASCO|nr:Duf1 protein [Saccharomycopsis crataegensis]